MEEEEELKSIEERLSEAKVCEAAEKLVNSGYITRKFVVRITTGSQVFDELPGVGKGGIEILPKFYAHSYGSRPDRIAAVAERIDMEPGAVLDNIIYARAYSYEHQYNLLLALSAKLAKEPFRLLIADSVIALFRADFTGRGEGGIEILPKLYAHSYGSRPDRIAAAAERIDMEPGAVLDNIIYARAYSYEHQYNLLLALSAKLAKEPFRLLIADSVIALFRADFTGRGEGGIEILPKFYAHSYGSRPDRIAAVAERIDMEPGAVLDNIIYARAYSYEHQYNLLLALSAKLAKEPFRLLIADSVIALFRADFTGRGELVERQSKLAEKFNVEVYMTNQVKADAGGDRIITDPRKPAGGHVLPQAATRMLRKGKDVCKVFDAPDLQEFETVFQRRKLIRKPYIPLFYMFAMMICSLMGTTQAFHHYIYAQTWAPTSCYWNPCNHMPALMENRFILHGLWPASQHIPNLYIECVHPHGANMFIGLHPLVDADLLRKMEYYWPGLRMLDDQFWDHQWRKHGSCSNLEKTHYATLAIGIHSSIDIFTAMQLGGIHPIPHTFFPYQLHSRRRLKQIVAQHFPQIGAAEPELICKGFKELEEIRWCISRITGNFIDCNSRGNCKNWFRFVVYRSEQLALPSTVKLSLRNSIGCSEQSDKQVSNKRKEFNATEQVEKALKHVCHMSINNTKGKEVEPHIQDLYKTWYDPVRGTFSSGISWKNVEL